MTVQSHPQVSRDLVLAARQGLLPARGSGWLSGFANMLSKELGEWFHTRKWLWQLLIWMAVSNGFIALVFFVLPVISSIFPMAKTTIDQILKAFTIMPQPEANFVFYFFSVLVMTGVFGVIILAQDEIIQEKQSGTAAWILSKPAARQGFILTKLLSNSIGILVFMIAIPGLIVQVEIFMASHKILPLVPFLAGCAVTFLVLLFYLSLVIMLGVLFDTRGKVLGLAIGVYFVCQIAKSFLPQIALALPSTMDAASMALALGQPLMAIQVVGVISIATLSLVFILVALWRFQHKEF
jgi:ABC-2 type transport system permease protein